jgi:hypothetical protein
MTTFTAERIQEIAAAIYAKEQEAVRQERIKAEADRIEAQRRAERALAEERARVEKAEMDAAIAAELQRLRNRGPVETLQDEMASLKKTLEDMKNGPQMKMTAIVKTVVTERKFLITCPNLELQLREPGGWSCNFSDKENNIVFHFNPRPHSNIIVLNSFTRNSGSWDRSDHLPLSLFDCSPGNQILFTLTKDGFRVSAKGTSHSYPHRFANVNILDVISDMASLNEKNSGDRVIGEEL